MRLDIGPLCSKQLAQAINRQLLHLINHLTTTIVAFSGKSLGIFIGQYAALRFHHLVAGEVFTGYQFNPLHLSVGFTGNQVGNLLVAHGLHSRVLWKESVIRSQR